ncbi:MAG: hypothetical protein ACLFT6_08540, partial [Bacteroidales bacterium]
MVDPIYIVASGLGIAFLLGILKHIGKGIPGILMLITLGFMSFISIQWLWAIALEGHSTQQIFTAGFKPPFSIQLLMGRYEAIITSMVN